MNVIMDADCLIKFTKAGAEEVVISEIEVHILPLVKKEIADEAKIRGYQDAFIVEENISRKALECRNR